MNIGDMTLIEVRERITALDLEVEGMEDVDKIKLATEEKKQLLERKDELKEIERRQQGVQQIQGGAGTVIEKPDNKGGEENMNFEEMRATKLYRDAYLKSLLNRKLTEDEQNAISYRDNEMTTSDMQAIATMTYNKIFDKLTEYAPLIKEIDLLQVAGNVSLSYEDVTNPATAHGENTLITPSADSVSVVNLFGYEVVKLIRISATVSKMSIDAFENWLVDKIAEKIAAKVSDWIVYGTGSTQPKGIDYARTWTDKVSAIKLATDGKATPAELAGAVGLLKAGYHRRAKWVMNRPTLFKVVVPNQDNAKFKVLSDDYKYLLGYEVVFDDTIADGDIFFGDLKQVVGNLADNIKVEKSAESGFAYNAIDYRGTALFDCQIPIAESFVKVAYTLTAGK